MSLKQKIVFTLIKFWCMMFHAKYHWCYWSQFNRNFYRCNLCQCQFSLPRK